MDKLKILPTPKYVSAQKAEGSPVAECLSSYFFDGDFEDILRISLGFLPDCQRAQKADAELILTTDSSVAKVSTLIDEDWFSIPYAYEQGYILQGLENGKVLIYAKTQTGLAYGLMSLIQLPALSEGFTVKDAPDFRYRANKWLLWAETEVWAYDFGDGIEAFRDRILRRLDLCLKYKINMIFFDGWGADTERSPHYKSLIRELCRAARSRGIHLIFGAYTMGYGLSGHPFGKHFGKVHRTRKSYPDGELYDCLGTMKRSRRVNGGKPFMIARDFGGCLSNEALMDEKLDELCNFVREVEPGALYLHNMDSFLIFEEMWEGRCEGCRKKWQNDDLFAKDGMAGAFAEYFDRLNGALQSVRTECYDASKDLIIFNIAPGYTEYHVNDEEFNKALYFWTKVQEYSKVRQNVYPLFREQYYNKNKSTYRFADYLENVSALRFGVIAFCGGDGFYSDDLFPTTSLLHKLMIGSEVMISCCGHAFTEPLQLFNAEYMWNSSDSAFYNLNDHPSDFEGFNKFYENARTGGFRPSEIFAKGGMIDDICQKLYGDDAEVMSEFFRLRGENGECPAPHPCHNELGTRGSNGVFDFRWDTEWDGEKRVAFTKKLCQILEVSKKGAEIIACASSDDIKQYHRMLSLNLPILQYLYDYVLLYGDMEEYFASKTGDVSELTERIKSLSAAVVKENKAFEQGGFVFADVLGGALARRSEILKNMEYDLSLMAKSLIEGARIPTDRIERSGGAWW